MGFQASMLVMRPRDGGENVPNGFPKESILSRLRLGARKYTLPLRSFEMVVGEVAAILWLYFKAAVCAVFWANTAVAPVSSASTSITM